MDRMKKLHMLAAVALCPMLLGSVVVVAQDNALAGAWNLTFTVPMRNRTVQGVLTLEVDGHDLKGTFQREGSDTSSEVTGKIEGSSISFSMTGMRRGPGGGGPPGRGGGVQMTFAGTVEGDTMAGEFQVGDRGSGEWSAERAG
jgi:hypothetical protein